MLYGASITIVVICAAVAVSGASNFKQRFVKCVFFASYGLIFGLGPMMQSANADVRAFGEQARTEASLYSLAGLLMLLLGFSVMEWPTRRLAVRMETLRKQIAEPRTQRMLTYLFWGSLVITAASQLVTMHAKGLTIYDLIVGGRFEYRISDPGYLVVFALHLTSFAYVPAFLGLFLNRRYQIFSVVYVLIVGALFFSIFSKGTRSIPVALIMTFLVAVSIRYRISKRHVLYVSVVGVFIVAMAIGLSETRKYQNSLPFVESFRLLFAAETYEQMWDRDPLNYGANLVGAVAVFPDDHPYLCGATYRRMPFFFLKESQFPDLKPMDTNILFGLVVHNRPEELAVTCPPSILGDVYINFWGWWGLPALCLHGMLYCWMFRFMSTNLFGFLWVGPLSGRFLTLVHRGEPYEMFVLFVMFMILMGVSYQLCRFLGTQSSRRHSGLAPASRFAQLSRSAQRTTSFAMHVRQHSGK
jgi:hypothetical protein